MRSGSPLCLVGLVEPALKGLLKKVSFSGGVGRPRPTPIQWPSGESPDSTTNEALPGKESS